MAAERLLLDVPGELAHEKITSQSGRWFFFESRPPQGPDAREIEARNPLDFLRYLAVIRLWCLPPPVPHQFLNVVISAPRTLHSGLKSICGRPQFARILMLRSGNL